MLKDFLAVAVPTTHTTKRSCRTTSNINIEPRILRIQGVGEAFTLGADYSMRIWLKPDVMAQYKLIPSDVTAALAEQNIESATGTLGENSENTFQYTMKYRGRMMTPGRVRGDRNPSSLLTVRYCV